MRKLLSAVFCVIALITTAQRPIASSFVSQEWQLFAPAIDAKFITVDWQNNLYVITQSDEIYWL